VEDYIPDHINSHIAETHAHGGSDYVCLSNAFDYILGDKNADVIDVYEALNMWMCGFFGYLSVLEGGIPMDIPDLHDPMVRDQYRNDNRCTDPKVGGKQTLPSYSKGNPEIPDSIYETQKNDWDQSQENVDYGMKEEK